MASYINVLLPPDVDKATIEIYPYPQSPDKKNYAYHFIMDQIRSIERNTAEIIIEYLDEFFSRGYSTNLFKIVEKYEIYNPLHYSPYYPDR
ncbi:MAG: hypothetical protein Hyperionvirus22_4 [Hyperionvirus sp.]|uniref:Uncharacterized protein n=1 Tax=Hyperionvirus sp. TaxID=2487770 RepID=A0A3G5AEJ7_9VIRU|nr:MAG: hypothetical protein Hyperionvirus22_4 [Hyperionvirus sp.]